MLNLVDILLFLILATSVYTGWHRGFILGVLEVVRWVGSLLLGLAFYPYLASWMSDKVDFSPVWIPPFSFLVVAIVSSIAIQALGNWVLTKLPPYVHTKTSNRALGLLPGFLNGVITASILAVLLLVIPLPDGFGKKVQESAIASRLASYTDRIEMALGPIFDEAAQKTLTKITVQPGSEEAVELPFTVQNPTPDPGLEAEMLKLVNEERAKEGLAPLKADTALTRVARLHATDMFRRGYFSHYTPEGADPFDRIRKQRISFRVAGENLAFAPTLPIAHEGLMNSPGHKANILEKRFGRVGIGVMSGGGRRLMITQNFRN